MGLVASVLNSQTVLRGCDQEKTVKCSISSSPVPWVRRWVRNVIRTFEQGGSLTVTQLYVTKPHPLSGNFMDRKEMTAARTLQFKPNPTTKGGFQGRQNAKENFPLSRYHLCPYRVSKETKVPIFPLCHLFCLIPHLHCRNMKKMKLFSGEFREFPNYLITRLQRIQLWDLNSGGKYVFLREFTFWL